MPRPNRALVNTFALLLVFAFSSSALRSETVKDRRGAVLEDRANMADDDFWIYNDWQRGFAEAKRTGKPLLVVLRCVPCLACAGIDASVLTAQELQPSLKKFICVRIINANALDLSLFQFDYDLSFSTIFFNGDGTVYGRFGSWTHQKNSADRTVTAYKYALDAAVAIHHGYPANKASLAGKQGQPMPVNDPLKLPALAGKYKRELDWDGKVVQSCVHCHQVSDAIRTQYRKETKTIPQRWVYPMPHPETVGISFGTEAPMQVQIVNENSIAASAGIRPGDQLISVEGLPLVSEADLAWILHQTPEERDTALSAIAERDGKHVPVKIPLAKGWRNQSDISRRVGTWPMRAMVTGGILLKDLAPDERKARRLSSDSMALRAEHVGEYGEHAAAKKAGFKKEDLLVEVDGISRRMTESELIGHLIETKTPGDKVKVKVLRGEQNYEFLLPMQ